MPADAAAASTGLPKVELYSRDILRWASSLPHADRIDAPFASARRRSPVCGSEIAADVAITPDGLVSAVAFRARACALGQASASLLRKLAPGHSFNQLSDMRHALAQALAGAGDFDRLWPELSAFAPAREHPGRHAAILLPYDALIAALSEAG